MLNIRNSENEKLKEQIDLMAKKVESERLRNNAVLKKTELASSLNIQLRTEYQNQVHTVSNVCDNYSSNFRCARLVLGLTHNLLDTAIWGPSFRILCETQSEFR